MHTIPRPPNISNVGRQEIVFNVARKLGFSFFALEDMKTVEFFLLYANKVQKLIIDVK
jgi:hypothetical protein